MRIIFVRHGHPNYVDDCLTELGHKHAAAVAKRLDWENISAIYSSTCGRAYETAEYTAGRIGIQIIECDFMREISWGSVDNQPIAFDGHPWNTVDDMVAKGESILNPDWAIMEPFCRNKLVDEVKRVAAATDEWLETLGYKREGLYYRVTGKQYAEGEEVTGHVMTTDRTIAVFGHGGAGSVIFSHLFNLPYPFVCSTMNQDYTGITIVEFPDTHGALVKPRFEIMNDARHIRDLKIENIYDK